MAKIEWLPRLIDDKVQVTVRTNGHTNGVLMFEQTEYEFFIALMGYREGIRRIDIHEVTIGPLEVCGRSPVGLGQAR